MRIAVIADVHANIYALEGFLKFVERAGDVSQIWNIGDFLQIGPHPREVAEIVLGDSRFVNVLGNNELALVQRDDAGFRPEEFAHQDWTLEQIGDDLLAGLRDLPPTRMEHLGNQIALLVHVPEEARAHQNVNVVFCGHTHRQLDQMQAGIRYLNPGSLGASFKKSLADYAIVDTSRSGFGVDLGSLAYDDSNLKADYLTRNVPDAAYLVNMLKL